MFCVVVLSVCVIAVNDGQDLKFLDITDVKPLISWLGFYVRLMCKNIMYSVVVAVVVVVVVDVVVVVVIPTKPIA